MKKLFPGILISVLIVCSFLCLSCTAEQTDRETIRVGYFELDRFLLGTPDGQPNSGYSYDLLCEISSVNGWQYEFVYGSFSELLDKLYAGEIDLLPCTAYTEERAGILHYADESVIEEKYYITALSGSVPHGEQFDPSVVDGKRVAVVTGAAENRLLSEWENENGIATEKVYCDSFEDTWKTLDAGKADFVLNIDNAVPFGGYVSLYCIGSSYSYMVSAPDRPDLAEGVNDAIKTIKQISPFAISHLEEQYLSGALSTTQLSAKEEKWLDGNPHIRVGCFTNDIPFSFLDAEGNVQGAYPALLTEIMDTVGYRGDVEWILYDTMQQMHEALDSGEVDLLCSEYHRFFLTQQNHVVISDVINSVPMGMLMLENVRPAQSMRIATPQTRLGIYFTEEYYPDAEVVPCDSVPECIEKVLSGEADVALAHTSVLDVYSKEYDRKFMLQVCKNSCDVCFSAKPEDQALIMVINRGLRMIPANAVEVLEVQNTPTGERKITLADVVRKYFGYILFAATLIVLLIGFVVYGRIYAKKLQKQVHQITRQKEVIEEKEQELIVANRLANQASNAKTTFLNNMSHDIRTPMNAIIGFTGLAASHIDNKEQVKDYLAKIGQSSEHLLSLINDVLDMSRIESGKMNLNEKSENLSEILHTLRNIVQSDVRSKNLDFFLDTDVTSEYIVCDKLRLNQVLLNIVSNSIKYTKPGGTISLSLREKGISDTGYGQYEFRIKDNGMGMSEEFLKTIFEPFTRVKSTTVSGIQGTGLGMAITKNIVDMMGGTIEIKSKEGEGTETILNFLFKPGAEKRKSFRIAQLEGLRSLVVDDDTDSCVSVAKILRETGMRSEWCASGKEALIRTEEAVQIGDTFKVYIIDWLMPDMNGVETARRIRKIVGEEAPIIILTSYDWSDIEEEAREAGVSAFAAKPLFPSDLNDVLNRCCGNTVDTEPVETVQYDFTGKKILLVEDNEMNREIATAILEEDGFVVDTAEDGTVAVEKMKTAKPGQYDIILMDIQMPVMDGYEATIQIRALEEKALADIPIIAMTANAFEEDRKKAFNAGMNDHVAKPIDVAKLKETMKKYL